MIVEGLNGEQIEVPDGMPVDQIEKALQEHYGGQKPAELGGIPNVGGIVETSSAKDKDIGKSAMRGLLGAGEWMLAAPEEADQLERKAIDWLKNAGKDSPNELTKIFNRWGLNWEAFYNAAGGDLPLPNKDDMDWLIEQGTGRQLYEPKTPEGGAMEQFMQGLGLAGAGPKALDVATLGLGTRAMNGMGSFGKLGIPTGAGYLGSQMDKIYNGVKGFFTDPEFGMTPMKGNPALSNPMPPIR